MVLIIANIVTGLALKTSKPSSVNPRVCLFISSLFSPPRGQSVRKKQIQIMIEPVGKVKSNLLLFALAFGEEGRAGGLPRSPRQLSAGGWLRGRVLALTASPFRPRSQETPTGSGAFPYLHLSFYK